MTCRPALASLAAVAALAAPPDGEAAVTLAHALARLEAALRARAAAEGI